MPTITLRPTQDISVLNWVPTVAGVHYVMVNEAVADDATTELSLTVPTGGSISAADKFTIPWALPAYAIVTAVRGFVRWYATLVSTGTATLSIGVNDFLVNTSSTPTAHTTQQLNLSTSNIINSLNSNTPPTVLNVNAAVTGYDSNLKLAQGSVVKITQVYVEVDYIVIPPVSDLHETAMSDTVVAFIWTGVSGASGYQLYKDGAYLSTITTLTYTLSLTDYTSHTFSVRPIVSDFSGPIASATYIRHQPEVFDLSSISITSVQLSPNPVNINSPLSITVVASETIITIQSAVTHCGDFYSGEPYVQGG